jgi:hypothetical protein
LEKHIEIQGGYMKALQNHGGAALTSLLTLFAFAINSCAPIEMKKVVAQKSDYYSLTTLQNGMKISVDLYKEKERLKESFGCDLLSRGILPVFVVVENQNAEDGYILLNENAQLVMTGGMTDDNKENEGQKTDELTKAWKKRQNAEDNFGTAMVLFGAIGVATFLPSMFSAEKKYGDEFEIRRNLEQKQIVTKTIYQGGSHSGFLYFNLGHEEDLSRLQGISLSIRNIRTNEITSFTINTNNQ